MNKSAHYDVAIAGAGMVGATLALALAQGGLRVALLERRLPVEYRLQQDYGLRVSALSLASQYLLRNLGVWPAIAATRISPYREMHVWDALGKAHLHFDCAELQLQELGHIVENDLIQNVLLQALRRHDDVDLLCPADIAGVDSSARKASVQLDDGRRLYASLLVGADGAASTVRQAAGIGVKTWPYHQLGIVAVVQSQLAHRDTAWQRFLPTGPLALLPLADGRCSIVWSTSETAAQRLLALDDDAFCDELTRASENYLGRITACGPRAAFPLCYQHAASYIKDRIALVGDAAHVVHPLAGQGVNLGLLDVARLAGLIRQSHSRGGDPGSLKLLRRYQRHRYGENHAMALAFDGLKRLFGIESKPVVDFRNAGLAMLNRLPALKRFLMLQAAGLHAVLQDSVQMPAGGDAQLLASPDFTHP